MSSDLDADFLSSVHSLSKELQLLGVSDKILTTSQNVACQSLLGTAWMLVQFIHCNSVATAESTLHNERENRLRDELQTTQTQLQRYKDKLEDKENQIKSIEQTTRKVKAESQKFQDTAESLRSKVKQMEAKIEKCHGFYKNQLLAQAADADKLRERLRSKIGIARKISGTDSLADGIDKVLISTNIQHEENKIRGMQETLLSLTTDNQILVEENLLMRDTLARLHRHLDAARKHGVFLLEILGIDDQFGATETYDYPQSIFNLPISVVMEKLRNLGEAQTEAIIKTFRSIEKTLPSIGRASVNG